MFGDGSKKIKSGTLKDYVVAETEVLNGNNAQYIDLRKFSPTEKLDELTVDGLHPNAKGHKLIAEKITENINNHLLVFAAISKDYLWGGEKLKTLIGIEKGNVVYSNNLIWKSVPLVKTLKEALNLPVYVTNDANAAALAVG